MERYIIRSGPAFISGLFLAGCLGGALDTPTNQPEKKDTVVVTQPPPQDTTPGQGGSPQRTLYPALKTGEKWTFFQWSGNDTGATATLEVVGDSVIGADSVFVEQLSMKVPTFIASDGTIIQNYKQTGRLYLRRSDQEAVHDTIVTRMDLWFPGDSAATPYREEEWSMTAYTGALPDSLQDGASWKVTGTRHQRTIWYFGEQVGGKEDTTLTRIRSYAAKASADLAVKAGTFPVIQLDWSDAGSTAKASGWFAPSAKAMVREIDFNGATSDTTELVSYLLK